MLELSVGGRAAELSKEARPLRRLARCAGWPEPRWPVPSGPAAADPAQGTGSPGCGKIRSRQALPTQPGTVNHHRYSPLGNRTSLGRWWFTACALESRPSELRETVVHAHELPANRISMRLCTRWPDSQYLPTLTRRNAPIMPAYPALPSVHIPSFLIVPFLRAVVLITKAHAVSFLYVNQAGRKASVFRHLLAASGCSSCLAGSRRCRCPGTTRSGARPSASVFCADPLHGHAGRVRGA
jgi:hypothetical protein